VFVLHRHHRKQAQHTIHSFTQKQDLLMLRAAQHNKASTTSKHHPILLHEESDASSALQLSSMIRLRQAQLAHVRPQLSWGGWQSCKPARQQQNATLSSSG
jgi:hypothetical protein